MSADVLNLLDKSSQQKKSSKTTSASKVSSKATPKNGSSLFDNMLQKVKNSDLNSSKTKVSEKSEAKVIVKTTNLNKKTISDISSKDILKAKTISTSTNSGKISKKIDTPNKENNPKSNNTSNKSNSKSTSKTDVQTITKRLVDIVSKNTKSISITDETDIKSLQKTIDSLPKDEQNKIFQKVSKKLVDIIVENKKTTDSKSSKITSSKTKETKDVEINSLKNSKSLDSKLKDIKVDKNVVIDKVTVTEDESDLVIDKEKIKKIDNNSKNIISKPKNDIKSSNKLELDFSTKSKDSKKVDIATNKKLDITLNTNSIDTKDDIEDDIAPSKSIKSNTTIESLDEKPSSLMESLLKEISTNDKSDEKNTKTIKNDSNTKNVKDINNSNIRANIFLSSQKNQKDLTSMATVKEAKDNIEEKKSIKAVKDSAKMLDLGLDEDVKLTREKTTNSNIKDINKIKDLVDTDIKDKESISKEDKKVDIQKGNTARVLFENKLTEQQSKKDIDKKHTEKTIKQKAILKEKIDNDKIVDKKIQQTMQNKEEFAKTISSKTATISEQTQQTISSTGKVSKDDLPEEEHVVNIKVPSNEANILKNRIIGAHQKMGNFMSDIARSMYQNYKPPVTAFRMNLNPSTLGSISVVIKSNKSDNSISVSMNMSNSATLDVFADNKASLQNALARNLSDNSNLSLNFGMQQDGSGQQQQQQQQSNSGTSFTNRVDEVDESLENTTSVANDEIDYM